MYRISTPNLSRIIFFRKGVLRNINKVDFPKTVRTLKYGIYGIARQNGDI